MGTPDLIQVNLRGEVAITSGFHPVVAGSNQRRIADSGIESRIEIE